MLGNQVSFLLGTQFLIIENTKKNFFLNWLQFPFYFTPVGKAA